MTGTTTPGGMTPQTARQAVAGALRQVAPDVDLDTVDAEDDLPEAAQLDSLDFLRFVETLSGLTGVRIDEVDYPRVRTVSQAVEFLCGRHGQTAG